MTIVTQAAPDFRLAAAVSGSTDPTEVALGDFAGRWLLLLFYPRDFSFVCPTEMIGFSARAPEFARRNCSIVAVSVDSVETHREWLQTPVGQGGTGALRFPLASDVDGALARAMGVWLADKRMSARALFLIDPSGVVQYGAVHNLAVGRSVDETLRVLDALQTGGLCPASWTAADGTIDLERALHRGRVLGHYRIEDVIGEGTFGVVFAARDQCLERRVALKLLKQNSAESRAAILREARAAAALHHPNVAAIHAIEEEEGLPLIVMELVDGRPLSQLLLEPLDLDDRLRLARGVASGLAAAHAIGLVHGDLKPANILVADGLVPKILDFGLARYARDDASRAAAPGSSGGSQAGAARPSDSSAAEASRHDAPAPTRASVDAGGLATVDAPPATSRGLRGTPAYMAPEQWRGEPATPASDRYAWGLIFFELLTGRRAVAPDGVAKLLAALHDHRLPERLSAQIPAPYRELLESVLAVDPAVRPTAAEIVERLA